jgi:hypothetical protein
MATPAYQLRTNKAVDRYLFISLLRKIIGDELSTEYRYYGFGGPYLEDFALIHATFPQMETVSVELYEEVFKRQQFHANSSKCTLRNANVRDFIATLPADKKAVFWLDFTSLTPGHLDTYMELLRSVPCGSIVRISLEIQPQLYVNPRNSEGIKYNKGGHDKEKPFLDRFSHFLSGMGEELELSPLIFCKTVQKMVAVAAQRALPTSAQGLVLSPLSSFYYKDGAGMYTHTGIVCGFDETEAARAPVLNWPYASFDWANDIQPLEMPVLSTKERLKLQHLLPCNDDAAPLIDALGYQIEGAESERLMLQYAKFYKEYPHFIKATI